LLVSRLTDDDVNSSAGSRLRVIRGAEEISLLPTVLVDKSLDVIALQLLTILSGDCILQRSVTGSFDSFDMSENIQNLEIIIPEVMNKLCINVLL
jgi:hypothetical protein